MPDRESLSCAPIGLFRTELRTKVEAPRQPGLVRDNSGRVELDAIYEAAATDLEGFEYIWLVTWLDRADGWRPNVRPPRSAEKRSVLATRSPHRPNPIGLSAVRLERVEGCVLHVLGHDLIDATPVLDVKPYVPYADAHPAARVGWLEHTPSTVFDVAWTASAQAQRDWLAGRGVDLAVIDGILALRPRPAPSHRVKELSSGECPVRCEFAFRTWRIDFGRDDVAESIVVSGVRTGHSTEVLEGDEESRWDDVPLHRAFDRRFTD